LRTGPASVEEQDVSEIDSGQTFRDCDPLRQFGDLESELDRKVPKPCTALNQVHTGHDLSQRRLAGLGVVIV
jgi:hypothetical protein